MNKEGLLIFEGVRNALFAEDEEGNREMVGESDEDVGCRILDMGNWGRADVGGGAGSLAAALTAIVIGGTESEFVHRMSYCFSESWGSSVVFPLVQSELHRLLGMQSAKGTTERRANPQALLASAESQHILCDRIKDGGSSAKERSRAQRFQSPEAHELAPFEEGECGCLDRLLAVFTAARACSTQEGRCLSMLKWL